MKFAKIFFLFCLTVFSQSIFSEVYFDRKLVDFPQVSVEAIAEVGNTLISRALVSEVPASMDLLDDINMQGRYMFVRYQAKINAGNLLFDSRSERDCFWSKDPIYLKFESESSPRSGVKGGVCYTPNEDKDEDGEFYFRFVMDSGNSTNEDISEKFEHKINAEEVFDGTSFKRELVYSGISQNILSIVYREYKDNIARPAFQQELKYDLTKGNVIGFKGARFKVIDSDNIAIKYIVIKHLD